MLIFDFIIISISTLLLYTEALSTIGNIGFDYKSITKANYFRAAIYAFLIIIARL